MPSIIRAVDVTLGHNGHAQRQGTIDSTATMLLSIMTRYNPPKILTERNDSNQYQTREMPIHLCFNCVLCLIAFRKIRACPPKHPTIYTKSHQDKEHVSG